MWTPAEGLSALFFFRYEHNLWEQRSTSSVIQEAQQYFPELNVANGMKKMLPPETKGHKMKKATTHLILVVVALLIGATPSSIACDIPSGLSAGHITATSAVLSWTAVSVADHYNVAWQKVNSGFWNIVANVKTASTSIGGYPVGLSPDTNYRFMVQAVCSSGFSAYSSPVSFRTSSK